MVLVGACLLLAACAGSGGGGGAGAAKIDIDTDGPAGGASGRHVSLLGGTVVDFSVTPQGPGQAEAVFSSAGGPEVVASITGPEAGTLIIGGVAVDGIGALTAAERAAVEAMVAGPMAETLTLVPLELGCHGEADLESAAMAALLLPWQVASKYVETDRVAAALEAAAASSCRYFPEVEPDGKGAAAPHLLFGPEVVFPVVFGFFPFDDQGAIDGTVPYALPPAPAKSIEGTGGSRCRGACGLGCTTTNCTVKEAWYCVQDGGEDTGEKEQWQTFTCGVAAGCIVHDACYDNCNALYGKGSFWAIHCKHARFFDSCDTDAQSMYGAVQCAKWAAGYGPYDTMQDFHYPADKSRVSDPECGGAEPDVVEDDAAVATGVGACVNTCQTCCPYIQEVWGCRDGVTSQEACNEETFPEVGQQCVSISGWVWHEGNSCAGVCAETRNYGDCPLFKRPAH